MSWVFFALMSAVAAAGVAIFGKLGIKGVDSTLATTVRSVVMAVFLVIVSAVMGKFQFLGTITNRVLLFIVLAGISGAMSWLFYFFALRFGPATGVAALDRLSVVFVLILAAFFLGESLTWKTGMGGLLITAGALLMVWR